MTRRVRGWLAPSPQCLALLSLLGLLACWRIAWAQPELRQVATEIGVSVAVPANLRQVPGLAALPGGSRYVEGLAAFTDDGEEPLSVLVRSGEAHGWKSLPAGSTEVAAEWTRRFAEALALPEAYDFSPGSYDAKRGGISLKYKVLGPSFARLMLGVPDQHPLWAPTLEAGEDPKLARCLLEVLLGGQPSATEAELRFRVPAAASQCDLPETMVDGYREQLGADEFAPAVSTVSYLSFFTRQGSIAVLVFAPLERQQAVDEAARLIWRDTEVEAGSRLPVSTDHLFQVVQLGGIVLGSLLGVLLLGGGLSWLLTRVGVPTAVAVGSALGLLCVLALTGLLRAGMIHIEGVTQAASYLLLSAIAFRPLVRWFASRKGSLLPIGARSRSTRGVSTVEYIILLGVVALFAIGAWRVFNQSVRSAISKEGRQVATLEGSGPDDNGSRGPGSPKAGGPTRIRGVGASANAPVARPSEGSANATGESGAAAPTGTDTASLAQAGATGVFQGILPGSVVTAATPPVALPANAGPVLAAAAKEPSLVLRGTDVATDFIPGVSNVKDATIAITGVNPVTKEHVGTAGRVMAGVFGIPELGNVLKYIGKGGKFVLKGGKAAYEGVVAARAASKAAKALEREVAREALERAEKEAAERVEKAVAERAEKEGAERAATRSQPTNAGATGDNAGAHVTNTAPNTTPPERVFVGTSKGDVAVTEGGKLSVGLSRELRVAEITGGRIGRMPGSATKDLLVRGGGTGARVDVVGPGGELIAVGGPSKAANLGGLGDNLTRLKTVANAKGVQALAYFEQGTPSQVIELAQKLLGAENVRLFPR